MASMHLNSFVVLPCGFCITYSLGSGKLFRLDWLGNGCETDACWPALIDPGGDRSVSRTLRTWRDNTIWTLSQIGHPRSNLAFPALIEYFALASLTAVSRLKRDQSGQTASALEYWQLLYAVKFSGVGVTQ